MGEKKLELIIKENKTLHQNSKVAFKLHKTN